MRNGKSPLVWLAVLIMVALIAYILVYAEGARREAQKDRPGGPVPMLHQDTPEKKGLQ